MKGKKIKYIGFLIMILCIMMSTPVMAAKKPRLNKTKINLFIGSSQTLTVRNAKVKVRWRSSNSAIASVNSRGKVKARRTGTCIITANVSGKKLRCKVAVKSALEVSRTDITIGNSGGINVLLRANGHLRYTISNSSIVSCRWGEWSGAKIPLYVTGKRNGTTYITISNSYNSQKKRVRVTVKKATSPAATSKNVYQVNMDIFAKRTEGGSMQTNTDRKDAYFMDNYGNSYRHSFYAGKGTVTYLTNYKYQTFKGTVACPKGMRDDSWRPSASLYIYGDGRLLKSFQNMNCYARPIPFSLNISGYERITMEWVSSDDGNIWRDWGYYATIFDGIFTKK